ncbi:MAG: NADAR family protein [Bacteroidales bacterium]|nr:NADAR family protein [Bacteroidales bacterium]
MRILKVAEEWGVFSNFGHTPIVVEGVTFDTSERLFQLMKFKDEEPVKTIFSANNPKMTSKHWEKTHRREDWGKMIIDAMKFCLTKKYEQNEEFRQELERSKGKYIVEDQSSFPKKNPDAWGVKLREGSYVGPNLLGRLLMELRDKGNLEYQLPADAFVFIYILKK